MTEKCTDCIHEWVCGLPSTTIHEECCPGFLDKNKCKEIIYARWVVPDDYYPHTCTNCRFEYVHYDEEVDYVPNYCPNCGALMVLGDFK